MRTDPIVLRVAVPVPIAGSLDYLWTQSAPIPQPGCRIRVPLGKSERVGVVLERLSHSQIEPIKLKEAVEALDSSPILSADLLATLRWCAQYYHHPLGEVVSHALPALLRRGHDLAPVLATGWQLTTQGRAQDINLVGVRAPRQGQALAALLAESPATNAHLKSVGITRDTVNRLTTKGWVERVEIASPESPPTPGNEKIPTLTDDQQLTLDAIAGSEMGYQPYLLQGVTGSGKTEVYLRLIAEQLKADRQSLLLVPEIGLTPQLVARLKSRFGDRLALTHSGLSDRERLNAWRSAYSGEAKLVVGTRSAIFSPLPNPGLIIVDEEHDPSYKQQEGFRYSARDLAVFRAKQLKLPVLLASATPSLESVFNARQQRYKLLQMPNRVGLAGPPSIRIIDLKLHAARNELSSPLIAGIERHLKSDNQVLLFLNRRGYAPVLFCAACQVVEECSGCDSRMTIHAASGRLRCHHCGFEKTLSWACAECGAERIAVGAGTQRVTEELMALFPDVRIARLDRDSTNRKGVLADILAEVESGATQILVGTQMLTKGHDFPKVTMVGVLNADQGLLGADFRSTERLAQTLLQVGGRAGRRETPGEVFIQTHYPGHPLLDCLMHKDYGAFAEIALEERRESLWPPYSYLAVWRAQSSSRTSAHRFLSRIAVAARRGGTDGAVTILGPAAAAMERRGGQYRAQLLFRCKSRAPLQQLMQALQSTVRSWPQSRQIRWSIDIDPAEL
jgi:primosomal protein N' (replication factor Y) (superfamily II helicase)